MVLLLHIIIALGSIVYTTYLFIYPSVAKLRVSCSLVALTLISGTYLVWSQPSHIRQACVTGLVYIGAASFGIMAAHNKLANAKRTSDKPS
jgi:hypothetical protein